MNNLDLPRCAARTQPNVMETIMQPLPSSPARSARWLMAAGLAFAAMLPRAGAHSRCGRLDGRRSNSTPARSRSGRRSSRSSPRRASSMTATTSSTTLRFGARGDPAQFLDPNIHRRAEDAHAWISATSFRPASRSSDVEVSGDGTDAAGGPLPAGRSAPRPTRTTRPSSRTSGCRQPTSTAAAFGRALYRHRITAKIDHAAFPAPTMVDNQGFDHGRPSRRRRRSTSLRTIRALPDDGDFLTGEPTSIRIDVTDCEPPPPPPPGGDEPCFEVVTGEVDCVPGAARSSTTCPSAPSLPASGCSSHHDARHHHRSCRAAGSGRRRRSRLDHHRRLPGDVVHLVVTGIETYAGPEEGVGLCCTQTVDLVIPR